MAANEVAPNVERNVRPREETRAFEKYLKPAVNIIEVEDSLVLTADLPGAGKETLDINVEKGILTINAGVSTEAPGRPVYTEFELAPYYRQFQVPESLNNEKARAEYADGVLTLRLAKPEAAKPRKIQVTGG
ncbi:Hsp20/alpha crystallin family protein [Geotalea sp. SG265]|uniref:Hsp20/alpha crystallin family protein n=1 Tax=Geotalea sp. SG265 TaxID=2922867 RepID=UPI001FAFEAA9|nr:Hsp20/alpha crystallin family protein [Geotalea sp. SG265]